MTVSDITSRTAVVTWQQPFSLIDIANYNVTVYEIPSAGLTVFGPVYMSVLGNSTMVTLTREMIRPNRQYNVSVVAYNRAGRGEQAVSESFMTQEDGELIFIVL